MKSINNRVYAFNQKKKAFWKPFQSPKNSYSGFAKLLQRSETIKAHVIPIVHWL